MKTTTPFFKIAAVFALCIVLNMISFLPSSASTKVITRVSSEIGGQVFVFFNQDYYAAGDTAFFQVWVSDQRKSQNQSQLIHIDLFGKDGSKVFEQNFKVKNGSGNSQLIFPASMQPGVYDLYIYLNEDKMPSYHSNLTLSGEKEFVLEATAKTDSLSPMKALPNHVEVNGTQKEYLTRSKITGSIKISDEKGMPLKGTYSVRVVNKKVIMKGLGNKQSSLQSSTAVSGTSKITTPYITWEGTIFRKGTREPVPDSTHVQVFLQKSIMGYDFYTLTNGHFKIQALYNFYEEDKLFSIAEYKGLEVPIDLVIDQPRAPIPLQSSSITSSDKIDWYYEYVKKRKEIIQPFYFFNSVSADIKKEKDPNDLFEEEFRGMDVSVRMTDFVIFPSMEEVIKEVIPALFVRRKNGEVKVGMNLSISLDNSISSQNTSLIIIDGAMTKDYNYLLNLDPAEVITIKLIRKINKLSELGLVGKDGIVLVSTKNAKIAKEILAAYPDVKGLTKPLPYSVHSHNSNDQLRVPDLRSCLYWSPGVLLDSSGGSFSFYASDDLGEYLIQVMGLTSEGNPFYAEKEFNVVRPLK